MADKGRDLTARFVTDTDQFHTDKAAAGLDDVARSADRADDNLDGLGKGAQLDNLARDAKTADEALDDAARAADKLDDNLDDLEQALKDAERELKANGDASDDLGAKLRDAFDRAKDAAKQAREASDDVGDGLSNAKDRVKEFGAEGTDTAREVAASFDGSASSIVDGFQEVAANAAAAFGPIGLAVGIAAAVGLGALRAEQERTREETNRLKAAIQALESGTTDADTATREYLDGLEDQGKTLQALKKDADALGIGLDVLVRAQAGNRDAIDEVTAATEAYVRARDEQSNGQGALGFALLESVGQTLGLSEATADLGKNADAARETTKLYQEALGQTSETQERARETQEAYSQAVTDFSDPAGAYQETVQAMAQKTADATKDTTDSWEDYADKTGASLTDVNDTLEKQVQAAENWKSNMTRLAGQVSDETLEYLAKLGPEGAPLVQQLVDASDEEMARFEDLMKRRAASGVDGVGTALLDGKTVVADAGKTLGEEFAKQLADSIARGSDDAVSAAKKIRDRIKEVYADKITQTVDVQERSLIRQEQAMALRNRP